MLTSPLRHKRVLTEVGTPFAAVLVPALLRGPALGSDAGHRARVLGRTPCGPVPEPQLRPIHAPQRSRCSPFPVARVEVRSS